MIRLNEMSKISSRDQLLGKAVLKKSDLNIFRGVTFEGQGIRPAKVTLKFASSGQYWDRTIYVVFLVKDYLNSMTSGI